MRPSPRPLVPGDFDLRRGAYFKQIGAVGFAIGTAVITQARDRSDLRRWVNQARAGIQLEVYSALADKPNIAGIIAAVTVGHRAGVVDEDQDALRAHGLAYLLAISGLHFGLAAGVIFCVSRLLLALPHGVAFRILIHNIAALMAILAAAGHLAMSGAAPLAQRVFVMVTAGMLSVMVDRLCSGLWFIAWAAAIVIAAPSDVVVVPSFQLSFAAATGIVSAYEAHAARRQREAEPRLLGGGLIRYIWRYASGIAGPRSSRQRRRPLRHSHISNRPQHMVLLRT